jgi:hypothetical protein
MINPHRRRWLNLLLVAVVVFLIIIFGLQVAVGQTGARIGAWYHQREWTAKQLNNYRYIARISCFCGEEVTEPILVEVHNGALASIIYINGKSPVTITSFNELRTIEDVFDIIRNATQEGADHISVTYDATYGFPSEIHIDYRFNTIDDEISYSIKQFEVLK